MGYKNDEEKDMVDQTEEVNADSDEIVEDDIVATLQAENADLKDRILRAMAETENVRRRLEQQAEDRGKYAINKFATDILPVADNLRRALENISADAAASDDLAKKLIEGVEMTERSLISMLERHGIKKIEAIGQKFDANLHQAMMEVEDANNPAGSVVYEMQAGYTIHGRLLRAAMVGVAKSPPTTERVDTMV